MIWKPHVTVAAIARHEDSFLLVEERAGGELVLNQPAGHLEPGEGLLDAVIRETREEAARDFHPESVVGVYRWYSPLKDETFLRVCFCGQVDGHDPEQPLDEGIQRALWVPETELRAHPQRLRSPLVLHGIDDFLAGKRYSLDLFRDIIES